MQLLAIIFGHGRVVCAGQRGQYMSLVRMAATLPSGAWQCLDHPQLLVAICVGVLVYWPNFRVGHGPFLMKVGSAHLPDFDLVVQGVPICEDDCPLRERAHRRRSLVKQISEFE